MVKEACERRIERGRLFEARQMTGGENDDMLRSGDASVVFRKRRRRQLSLPTMMSVSGIDSSGESGRATSARSRRRSPR
jgi:hypothetical protein